MRSVKINIYKVAEHPNKELVFKWIKDNWHDIGQSEIDDVVASLQALKKVIGGRLNWSICAYPDRSEGITFEDFDKEALNNLSAEDLPLTGVCWDFDVIECTKSGDFSALFKSIHSNIEHLHSDKALIEMCEGNDYEFLEDGSHFTE